MSYIYRTASMADHTSSASFQDLRLTCTGSSPMQMTPHSEYMLISSRILGQKNLFFPRVCIHFVLVDRNHFSFRPAYVACRNVHGPCMWARHIERLGAHEGPAELRGGGVYQFPIGNHERHVTFCIPDHINTPRRSHSAWSTGRF